MSERDDLIRVLRDASEDHPIRPDCVTLADAVLADGWVPAERLTEARQRGDAWKARYRDLEERCGQETEHLRAERDALAATVARVRDLCDEWQYGEYSATELEPGIAYCADRLAKVLAPSDPATDTGGEGHG